MRHFMENLRCLEVVKVKVQVVQQDKYLPLTSDLMKLLPAASSKCKIQFIDSVHIVFFLLTLILYFSSQMIKD